MIIRWIVASPAIALIAYFVLQPFFASNFAYRYKLTIEVDTPAGPRSSYTVGQVRFTGYPKTFQTATVAEALYLDLGPDLRPIIALTGVLEERMVAGRRDGWGMIEPTIVLARAYGEKMSGQGWLEKIMRRRGAQELPIEDLPILVTFEDASNPRSVILVQPLKLEDTIGPGVSFRRATIEVTDDKLTTGIDKKLPWLVQLEKAKTYLDGSFTSDRKSLVNALSVGSFKLRMGK